MANVFIVDDEDMILKVLSREITHLGEHSCRTFSSPTAALVALREADPDAIFSDLRMPVMDGRAFLARAKEIRPNARRVLVSATYDPRPEDEDLVDAFIEKPWDRESLLDALRATEEKRPVPRPTPQPTPPRTTAPDVPVRPVARDGGADRLSAVPPRLPRVLLVLEDDRFRRLLAQGLSGCSFSTAEARCVNDAREKLIAERFDIAVVDLEKPGSVGATFCSWLKARDGIRTIPVLGTTSLDEQAALKLCASCGADGFIQKPFSFDDLANLVRRFTTMTNGSRQSIPVQIDVSFGDDESLDDYAARLSTGEILVRSPRRLPLGSAIAVDLHVPGYPLPLSLAGNVAWVQRYPLGATGSAFGIGVALASDDLTTSNIRALIADFTRRPRVLVLDDDRLVLRLTRDALIEAGFAVFVTERTSEVEFLAREVQPDAIVLDLLVNGETAENLASRLKRAPATASIPVMIHTGRPVEEVSKLMDGVDVDGYVPKSGDFTELKRCVRDAVGKVARRAVDTQTRALNAAR